MGIVSAADNTTITPEGQSEISDALNTSCAALPEKCTQNEGDSYLKDSANHQASSYDNRYYLFRGDCWTVDHNFESSAAVTSESLSDLTLTGTFRTENDIVGLYWNSQDPITHPYISYGVKSDYSDVVLEFDYEMEGCKDFSNDAVNVIIASMAGETYYLKMNQFSENGHVTFDFNNLTLLEGNSYFDKNGQPVMVSQKTKLDVSDLKYIMFSLLPENFVENNSKYTIIENTDFSCKISNITVTNGEICKEQFPLEPHQYRLCEGYDDIYNLNPYRISKEMRKLGYAEWVDFYIGASYFYEKTGISGDLITDMGFNHNRTEKMVLDKNIPLNAAFKAWLDCYARELKNNGVMNLVISVSMENLQCPSSWRQMDSNGNFAMTGWEPSTFFYSPCNDEAVSYIQKVSEACLDIVVNNGLKPVLQMGETWWWWSEAALSNQSPYFYDNSTRLKYLAEKGSDLPVYDDVWSLEYDKKVVSWLNQQLVQYSDALREVVKGDRYADGVYMALFFPPSVTDADRVPPMITDINYIKDAYSPSKLDILQIEDYDWVLFENPHHSQVYTIGQDLGFTEDRLHYFGGFVQYPEDANKYWGLIIQSMDEASEKQFGEVFVWAGLQVRRDSKILGHDEDALLNNLSSPSLTAPEYASVGENFTISMHTSEQISGVFNVYDYNNGQKGELLSSNAFANGHSSVVLSSDIAGLNRFYLDFDCSGGEYHLIQDVFIIENSQNVTVNIADETELGSDVEVILRALKTSFAPVYISVDENPSDRYMVENGEFTTKISNLSLGYHTISIKYNDEKLTGEIYSGTFKVNVGIKTDISQGNADIVYDSNEIIVITLKDANGNVLKGKDILIKLNGSNYTLTTDDCGQAKLPTDLLPGNYSADILFEGADGYLSSSSSLNISVNKIATHFTAKNISVLYGDGAKLVITLKDNENRVLAGQNVTIKLNNKVYNKITGSNGQIKLSVNLPVKTYTAQIRFAGSDIYKSSSCKVKVAVKKATPKFVASSKTFKSKAKTKKVTAKLKNKNKLIAKVTVKLTVNKKTYKVKTNSKGIATFKIKLTKKGKYSAILKYSGNSNYKSTNKKIKITIK